MSLEKILKLTDVLFSVHIIDALNTKTSINWSAKDATTHVGIGEAEGMQLTLTISEITSSKYTGYKLEFFIEQNGVFINSFNNEFGKQFSKIIGAVINGFNDKLLDHKFDFLCLVEKNHDVKRISVFSTVAGRFARSRKMHTKIINHDNHQIKLMIDYSIPFSEVSDLQRSLQISEK